MAENPINPSNFPNPAGGGPTPTELANFQRKIAEEAKKLGINVEKSYVDAYKKVTRIADQFEKRIRDQLKKRYEEERREILRNFGLEMQHLSQKKNAERAMDKAREDNLRQMYKLSQRFERDVENEKKKFNRPGVGATVKREITGLPLVGGPISTLMEGGLVAGGATLAIGAAAALIVKFVEALLKMNVATTRVNVGLLKAGVSQDFYNKKLSGAFGDIPKSLAGPEDFAKWISTLATAPKALQEVGRDNQGFETFLGHMGQMGVTLDESVDKTAKAALVWGGTFKDLDKEFLLAKKLTKDTGFGFDTLYDAMQDLNPVMKQLTFSSDEATQASEIFVDTMMKEFSKMGMAPEEAKGLTEALGGFIASMSGSKILGLRSLVSGMPKDIDNFFSEVSEGKVSMTELWRQSTEKIIRQMPKGMRTLGVMGMAEQGMLPTMFAQPKFAVAMSRLVESGGSDIKARQDIANAMKKQDQETANRAKGFETLANLNGPFSNLAQLLTSILDVIAGPLTGGVRSINDIITHFSAKGLFGMGGYVPTASLSPITRGGMGTATAQALINEMQQKKNVEKNVRAAYPMMKSE